MSTFNSLKEDSECAEVCSFLTTIIESMLRAARDIIGDSVVGERPVVAPFEAPDEQDGVAPLLAYSAEAEKHGAAALGEDGAEVGE